MMPSRCLCRWGHQRRRPSRSAQRWRSRQRCRWAAVETVETVGSSKCFKWRGFVVLGLIFFGGMKVKNCGRGLTEKMGLQIGVQMFSIFFTKKRSRTAKDGFVELTSLGLLLRLEAAEALLTNPPGNDWQHFWCGLLESDVGYVPRSWWRKVDELGSALVFFCCSEWFIVVCCSFVNLGLCFCIVLVFLRSLCKQKSVRQGEPNINANLDPNLKEPEKHTYLKKGQSWKKDLLCKL